MGFLRVKTKRKHGFRRKEINSSMSNNLYNRRKSAFYVWCPKSRGLFGPFQTRNKADYEGYLCKEPYKVVLLHTTNLSEASSIMKGKEVSNGVSGMTNALKRMKHRRR